MKWIVQALLIIGLLQVKILNAQNIQINSKLLSGGWPASWISCPGVSQRAYGVYHFRKTFTLAEKPDHFVVHVSADNRYRLFVNGQPVCSGPARGDLYNWYFETVDISAYLRPGNNTIAALVWNMGEFAAVAQISNQTGFVLQGGIEEESAVNTNGSWKVLQDNAYTPCSLDNGARLNAYIVIGPGDQVNGSAYPWGWEQPAYNDSQWKSAANITKPYPIGYGTDNMWTLAPRTIPLMEETMQRIPEPRRSTGINVSGLFLKGKHPLTIPANKTIRILLDQTYNTVAYPELMTSGGKNAVIKITYSEALFDKDHQKGNRNEIEGKEIIGNYDIFIPDGGKKRLFRPLWFRTYRFVQLEITTHDQPLDIEDFYGMRTGYPFQVKASFKSNDSSLQKIWDVGWHTAQLCAGETYFDCPYYEQLQYEGDTRIQSLISLYVTGDDRLMRKAILDFYHSRTPDGFTQGRYPSNRLQVIPTFSLFWVSMIYDYWMNRNDPDFVEQFLPAVRQVLNLHEKSINSNTGMLGTLKWWSFIDWVPGLDNSNGGDEGNTAIRTLQFSYTLQQAAGLFDYFHKTADAEHYRKLAESLNSRTHQLCFDKAKGVMADAPDKKSYSQHASILAVLSGAIPDSEAKKVMQNVLSDKSLSQATFYYRFYLTEALKKAGMADLYYSQLTPWRDMLKMGLTTFAEQPEPTRSDCHAWSSSPNYDFLSTICGIMPDAPGFRQVLIKPALGQLKEIKGVMPHPDGMITVWIKRKDDKGGIEGEVILPAGLSGRFVWEGKEIKLTGGLQKITI